MLQVWRLKLHPSEGLFPSWVWSFVFCLLQIVGPADGSNYIVDYYGARLTRLSITNETYRKPHLSLWTHLDSPLPHRYAVSSAQKY